MVFTKSPLDNSEISLFPFGVIATVSSLKQLIIPEAEQVAIQPAMQTAIAGGNPNGTHNAVHYVKQRVAINGPD